MLTPGEGRPPVRSTINRDMLTQSRGNLFGQHESYRNVGAVAAASAAKRGSGQSSNIPELAKSTRCHYDSGQDLSMLRIKTGRRNPTRSYPRKYERMVPIMLSVLFGLIILMLVAIVLVLAGVIPSVQAGS